MALKINKKMIDEEEIIIIKEIRVENKDNKNKNEYYYKNRENKINYQKEYNKNRGEKISEYNKNYYEENREKILEKAKKIIKCECGLEIKLFNLNSHKKTKKHNKLCSLLCENEFNK